MWDASGIGGANGKFQTFLDAIYPMNISDAAGGTPRYEIHLDVGIWNFGMVDVALPREVFMFVRICLLITALWLARKSIFGG